MPIYVLDIIRLFGGIFLLTIPGYLWSYIILKDISRIERVIIGFISTSCVLGVGLYFIDMIGFSVSQTTAWVLYLLFLVPAFCLFLLSVKKNGFKIPSLSFLKKPGFFLLVLVVLFAGFMMFLPHVSDDYYLPFHVDEWEHWALSRAVMKTGSTSFINPYLGFGTLQPQEIGFNIFTADLLWFSGSSFVTVFVFMPAIIAMFTALTAFSIGNRYNPKFGLEAAFLVGVIPTTCRMMGPSFYVPVTLGLLLIAFSLLLMQMQKKQIAFFLPFLIGFTFLMHPQSALAVVIVIFFYSLLLFLKKELKLGAINLVFSFLPILLLLLMATRWTGNLDQVLQSYLGNQTSTGLDLNLPKIWVEFEQMGYVVWGLCVIGVYYVFAKGSSLVICVFLSMASFLGIIGLYSKFGYGLPTMYERSFLFLFLMVVLLAGFGLAMIGREITNMIKKMKIKKLGNFQKHLQIIISLCIFIILILTVVPAHNNIGYYHMIDESEYKSYMWIYDNIDKFSNESHLYNRAAVDPFKASPFCAVTGLHIVSSTMSPIYGYDNYKKVGSFLSGCCENTSFLKEFKVSVVYTTKCYNNSNLTAIYPGVYLYPGLFD